MTTEREQPPVAYECRFQGGQWTITRDGVRVTTFRHVSPARNRMAREAKGEARNGNRVLTTFRPLTGPPVVTGYGAPEPGDAEGDPATWPSWVDADRWVPTETPENAGHPL